MFFRPTPCLSLLIATCSLFLAACGKKEVDVEKLREEARIVDGVKTDYLLDTLVDHERDLKRLKAFAVLFVEMEAEMNLLRESVHLEERGYYSTDEHDRVVGLLYRYLVARESLWDMVSIHARHARSVASDDRIRSNIIALYAANLLRDSSSKMVLGFLDNEKVVEKLNEGYHEYGIGKDSFETIFNQLTDSEAIDAVDNAFSLFEESLADNASDLSRFAQANDEYRIITNRIPDLYRNSHDRIEAILEKSSIALPNLRNRIRHTEIVKSMESRLDDTMEALYEARGNISDFVTGIKSPLSGLAEFGEEQRAELKAYLQPGDIILTFTEGYMSNIFLPGVFKHGITFVGTPEQRMVHGLEEWNIDHLSESKRAAYFEAVRMETISSGQAADLVEAVAEGVIFNSLDYLLDTHVNRLLVLRPQISQEELRDQLGMVMLLVGDNYDFNFDFTSGSRHCCTEVIYRSLHGKSGIEFNLVKRFGLQTLSADDIIQDFMEAPDSAFVFIAFAQEESKDSRLAKIYSGNSGYSFFKETWQNQ